MLKKQEILDGLAQFYGTCQWWKNAALNFTYTDGIKYLWESCESYWLLTAISSYKRTEPFQVWTLTVKDRIATLTMKEDKNLPVLVKQEIPYTDFPLDEIQVWLIDGTLILPSEY